MAELDTQKKQFKSSEIEKVAYKQRNIKGQVAHCSWGMWRLEGDNSLCATKVPISNSLYPAMMMAVKPIYACHLTEPDSFCLYVYHPSGDLRQA